MQQQHKLARSRLGEDLKYVEMLATLATFATFRALRLLVRGCDWDLTGDLNLSHVSARNEVLDTFMNKGRFNFYCSLRGRYEMTESAVNHAELFNVTAQTAPLWRSIRWQRG